MLPSRLCSFRSLNWIIKSLDQQHQRSFSATVDSFLWKYFPSTIIIEDALKHFGNSLTFQLSGILKSLFTRNINMHYNAINKIAPKKNMMRVECSKLRNNVTFESLTSHCHLWLLKVQYRSLYVSSSIWGIPLANQLVSFSVIIHHRRKVKWWQNMKFNRSLIIK